MDTAAYLRVRRALLAAVAGVTVAIGFAVSASAQSRHVRVAGRLIPEHASVTPQHASPAPQHGSHPHVARNSGALGQSHEDAAPEADSDPELNEDASRSIPAPELPETERVAEREDDAEAEGDVEDEALDGLLGPLVPREFGGVTGEYIYTGEVFMNARGGLATANSTRYRGNMDVVVQVDAQKQQLWDGGRFFIYGQSNHGRSISESYVGDYQLVSNLDPSPKLEFTQVSEYWYRQDFADGNFGFKVGKQDSNADFAYADLGGDFINPSFTLVPTVPLPTFPNPGLGLACFCHLHDHALVSGGIYDGLPDGGQWGFSGLGDNGCMSMMQLELHQPEDWGNGLAGTLRIGGWYHSGNRDEIVADPHPRVLGHNYGVWVTADKMLISETGEDGDEQGLGTFAQFGWAPGDRNEVDQTYAAGVLYRGPLEGRNLDVIGVGTTSVLFGSPTRQINGMTYEMATEVFYKAYLSDFVGLQFDLQYVTNPGGLYPDSIVPGVRFEVVL